MYFFWWSLILLFVVLVTPTATVLERKALPDIQSRTGPSKSGYFGILQPIVDAFKVIVKEYVKPRESYNFIYVVVAFLSFFIAALFWTIPNLSFESAVFFNEWTVIASFLISVLHVFTVLLAGWASNSRYSFLGALRTAAQLVAYDIVLILVYINILFYQKEFSFENALEVQKGIGGIAWFIPFQMLVFFITLLAETSRHPYDLPEAESEIVAGYNVEYSSIRFAMFFLAEYSTLVFSAITINTMFFSGDIFFIDNWVTEYVFWAFKILMLSYIIIKARGLVPRYRYDQLMDLGWKVLIPFECVTLFYNILISGSVV